MATVALGSQIELVIYNEFVVNFADRDVVLAKPELENCLDVVRRGFVTFNS
jgi:DUF917 family protein